MTLTGIIVFVTGSASITATRSSQIRNLEKKKKDLNQIKEKKKFTLWKEKKIIVDFIKI